VICASINNEVVHGIPSAKRKIADGDLVSVDFGVRLDGWCGDAAQTFAVGAVSQRARRLMDATANALAIAQEMIAPGRNWSEIARAMQESIEGEGFSVVEEFVGHGIGADMHEDPKVPNFVSRELKRQDIPLSEGMVLAVEPMVNMGTRHVAMAPDGWTVVTRDGQPSAHFENTLAVVPGGSDALTGAE
jgi:methionyl aminopeptidase